jgi:hypothetical protein
MLSHLTFLALDLARERAQEADHNRLAALARQAAGNPPSAPRRFAARGVASVSRGLASLARRLDDCTADDLAEALYADRLAPTN